MCGSDVTADRTAVPKVPRSTGSDRHDKDVAGDLRDHEPVRRWVSWVEQRVALPHLADILETEVRVLEQMRGLVIDLERILVVEQIDVQQPAGHTGTV
jgi:hypothetical protein